MASNLAIFHTVDLTIIVAGIAFWLWKYGQVRMDSTERNEKFPMFLLNFTLMMDFWLQTGAQAFLPGRTFDFYLSLVGAGATTASVVYTHLRLVQNLSKQGHAAPSRSDASSRHESNPGCDEKHRPVNRAGSH